MKKNLTFLAFVLIWMLMPNLGLGQASLLECNAETKTPFVNAGGFSVSQENSGDQSLVNLNGWQNASRLIDSNLSNSTTATSILGNSKWIRVVDNEVYPAGTWAGFNVAPVAGGGIGDFIIEIRTYNGNDLVETHEVTSGFSLINLDAGGDVGFVTTQPFTSVEFFFRSTFISGTTVTLNHPILLKYCSFEDDFECNVDTEFTRTDFPVEVVRERSGFTGITGGTFTGINNVIDANPNNAASIFAPAGLMGGAGISVRDVLNDYSAGHYVGVKFSNFDILALTLLDNVSIETYLNGTPQESVTGDNLFITIPAIGETGVQEIGFQTTMDFDEIRFAMSINGISLGTTSVYGFVVKQFCDFEGEWACNTNNAINTPEHPVYINGTRTGVTGGGCISCQVLKPDDLIKGENTASIQMNGGALTEGAISVKNGFTDWEANTFAGFDISNDRFIELAFIDNLKIELYNDNALVQSASGANLIDFGSIIGSGDNRRVLGILANQAYDEVRIVITNLLGVNLGSTTINDFVIKPFCNQEELVCNELNYLTNPGHPVYIGENSKIVSVGCVECELTNAENVINSDTNDYAVLKTGISIGSAVQIEVGDAINTYPAGTYAGFEVSNDNFLNINFLTGITLEFYMDDTLVHQAQGDSNFISVNVTGTGRTIFGSVAPANFNKVLLRVRNSLAGLDFGETKVYNVVLQRGDEACAHPPLACGEEYVLKSPDFNVVIESARTGFDAAVCVECDVYKPWNVIDNDPATYADINVTVGAGNGASISVVNLTDTYPAGSIAGFVVEDTNNFLETAWFEAITITTYLDGVQQEQSTSSTIWEFNLIFPWWGSNQNAAIGFVTSMPYDEIQITYRGLANILTYLRVYAPFVSMDTAVDCASSITGNVFLDSNSDGIQDDAETGTNLDTDLYVYLVDSNGIIIGKSLVDQNGNYQVYAENGQDYTLYLSAEDYPVGTDTNTTPIDTTLPNDYTNTGENHNDLVDANNDGMISVSVPQDGWTNDNSFNFGVNESVCAPDLTPSLDVLPTQIFNDNTTQQVRIVVAEINGCATDGSDIFVTMPTSPHYEVQPYDSSKTTSNNLPVLNADWEYLGEFGGVHYWRYIGNADVIAEYGITAFGIDLIYNANSESGSEKIIVNIFEGSGGEINPENNSDNEEIKYSYTE